jgi:CTP synthase (UTP-ammonia lyase)
MPNHPISMFIKGFGVCLGQMNNIIELHNSSIMSAANRSANPNQQARLPLIMLMSECRLQHLEQQEMQQEQREMQLKMQQEQCDNQMHQYQTSGTNTPNTQN